MHGALPRLDTLPSAGVQQLMPTVGSPCNERANSRLGSFMLALWLPLHSKRPLRSVTRLILPKRIVSGGSGLFPLTGCDTWAVSRPQGAKRYK